jgi:ribosomal protein S18 acetylase RimI-like enzyme
MPATAVRCEDWRGASPTEVQALLANEGAIWRRQLGWDVRDSWTVIEPARAAGALPGFIARDDRGRVIGWTWFLQHRGALQVAALVADDRHAIEMLVDAVVTSETARSSSAQVWSARDTSPALTRALQVSGLRVEPYLYMNKALRGAPGAMEPGAASLRAWSVADDALAPALFADAYRDTGHIRAFAPDHSVESWQSYLRTLFETTGCGVLLPGATLVAEDHGLTGATITTAIDLERGVAHLAQIAVSPRAQGQGLARTLLRASMGECRRARFSVMTLLVAEANTAARGLYESEGFKQTATFTIASDK